MTAVEDIYCKVVLGDPNDPRFMWDMLSEAIHREPEEPTPSREEVLSWPGVRRYLENWGRPGDAAVIAHDGRTGDRIGAAWHRLMPVENPGYGFVDFETPEIALAVVSGHRGRGVGEALLRSLTDNASRRNLRALSLSVRTDNLSAVRLYERCGFERLFRVGDSWTMKVHLTPERDAMTEHSLTLNVLEERLAVCRLEPDAELPGWVSSGPLLSVTRTAEELSVVCSEESVPEDVKHESGWRCLKLAGPFEFSLTGVLLSVLEPLAEVKVGIFAVSTFDTDYVLVKDEQLDFAVRALRARGHEIIG